MPTTHREARVYAKDAVVLDEHHMLMISNTCTPSTEQQQDVSAMRFPRERRVSGQTMVTVTPWCAPNRHIRRRTQPTTHQRRTECFGCTTSGEGDLPGASSGPSTCRHLQQVVPMTVCSALPLAQPTGGAAHVCSPLRYLILCQDGAQTGVTPSEPGQCRRKRKEWYGWILFEGETTSAYCATVVSTRG